MKRIPEPEIMSIEEEATVYALADFASVNQSFVDRLLEVLPQPQGLLVDLGCGPGDIIVRIAGATQGLCLIGCDGAEAMLQWGKQAAHRARNKNTISFLQGDAKALSLTNNSCDVVISNSLVHHLPDPLPFWQEVRRITKPGGTILVRDLARPDSEEKAWKIVERESGAEPQLLKDLFFYSLCAAYTVEEIEKQLKTAKLDNLAVTMSSDRHWDAVGRA